MVHNLDLFDLFDKYRNNTLTERDILLFEYEGYKQDWLRFNEPARQKINNQRSKKSKYK